MSDTHHKNPTDFLWSVCEVLALSAMAILIIAVAVGIVSLFFFAASERPEYEYELLERGGVVEECYPNVMKEC